MFKANKYSRAIPERIIELANQEFLENGRSELFVEAESAIYESNDAYLIMLAIRDLEEADLTKLLSRLNSVVESLSIYPQREIADQLHYVLPVEKALQLTPEQTTYFVNIAIHSHEVETLREALFAACPFPQWDNKKVVCPPIKITSKQLNVLLDAFCLHALPKEMARFYRCYVENTYNPYSIMPLSLYKKLEKAVLKSGTRNDEFFEEVLQIGKTEKGCPIRSYIDFKALQNFLLTTNILSIYCQPSQYMETALNDKLLPSKDVIALIAGIIRSKDIFNILCIIREANNDPKKFNNIDIPQMVLNYCLNTQNAEMLRFLLDCNESQNGYYLSPQFVKDCQATISQIQTKHGTSRKDILAGHIASIKPEAGGFVEEPLDEALFGITK